MEHEKIVWTSPSTWPTSVKIALGASAVVGVGALVFYLNQKNKRVNNDKTPLLDDPSFESKSLEEKAQLLKAQGNKMFQVRNYRKASELFTRAIDLLLEVPDSDEKKTNLAVLYNNYSACMEYEDNLNSALEYTSRAIALNPNYVKPYIRRSRIYKLKKDYKSAIRDLAKLYLTHAKTKDSEQYLSDLAEVSSIILKENVDRFYKTRLESLQFLPISQATTNEWMYQTVLHDPILNMMRSIGNREPEKKLDLAIYYLKKHDYYKVLPCAMNALEEKLNERDRFVACLLIARMYHFAGLHKQVQFMCEAIDNIWNNASEEFKSTNVDLLMALFVIKIYAESPEVVETQLKQNLELCTGNADPFIVLFMIYQSVANGEKANEMLELARKVEPNNQYIEYHEIASKFLRTTQAQDMLGLHNLTAEIDRRFHDTTDIPEFAILTAARIFHTVQNTQLSMELLNKYRETHNETSIIFDYLQMVLYHEQETDRANATNNLIKELINLAERDPYNFEINRMLFRCQLINDPEASAEIALRELLNARDINEFSAGYHDVILGFALSGRPVPIGDEPFPYKGPEYIHADSDEHKIKFMNLSA